MDEPSFADFTADAVPGLLGFAHRLAADPLEADRLVQNSLLSLQRSWSSLAADAEPLQLARARIVRTHTTWWRRTWVAVTIGANRTTRNAPPRLSDADLEVRRALRALPPRTRAAVVLKVADGMSSDQIAELLHCRSGRVAVLTTKGLATLRNPISSQVVTIDDAS